mmetsp:Transcript_41209/g.89812  ORF Transcript_41209/g.89812 Transcript_41209/m.89812 type:complete len:264 (+) Transcript_41209:1060-1851(+)
MWVLPSAFLGPGVHPIRHSIAGVLVKVQGQGVIHKLVTDPQVMFVDVWLQPEVRLVLLDCGLRPVCTVQNTLDLVLLLPLLHVDLHGVFGDSKGIERPLQEHRHILVLGLQHREQLIPDLCNVAIPVELSKIIGGCALRQVHDLEFGTKLSLTSHKYNLILVPLDNRFVPHWDVVLALPLVLRGVGSRIERPEGHNQKRSVIPDNQVPLTFSNVVLQILRLSGGGSLVDVPAFVRHRGLAVPILCGLHGTGRSPSAGMQKLKT